MKKTGVCILLLLAGCLALVALACGGGGGDSAPTPTVTPAQPVMHTLEGTFTLMEVLYGGWAEPCEGKSGYADIRNGAQVVIRDGTGTVIGTGVLGGGKRVNALGEEEKEVYDFDSGSYKLEAAMRCQFEFTISGLPKSDFYAIEVSHRGELTYSYSDLEARRWKVELTLGED